MGNIVEFKIWLTICCLDGSKKLGLEDIEITYSLICEAQKWLLKPLIEKENNVKMGR